MRGTTAAEIKGQNTFYRLEIQNTAGVTMPRATTNVDDSLSYQKWW